jgi:membrane protein implicated in regulation of membrane protease activity
MAAVVEIPMEMEWWHWAVLGLVLGLFELATPGGFFILFFGIGALIVSLLSFLHIAGPLWLQWTLFTVLSVVALLLFRDPLLRRVQPSGRHARVDALTDDVAVAKDDITPGQIGKAELRGTVWSARNVGPTLLQRGQRCAVRKVDGLLLHVTAEGA